MVLRHPSEDPGGGTQGIRRAGRLQKASLHRLFLLSFSMLSVQHSLCLDHLPKYVDCTQALGSGSAVGGMQSQTDSSKGLV